MRKTKDYFKTFPEFSELRFADKEEYEALIADYPPISEYSFANIMNWWSGLAPCRVSQLNGNLVICYWMPGMETMSGFSLLGRRRVDESIAALLDWIKRQGKPARLVHVPEFVISCMRYPELYSITSERAYDECIVSVKNLFIFSKMLQFRKWKVRRFMAEVNNDRVKTISLDLSATDSQQLLLDANEAWRAKGRLNYINKHEEDCLKYAVKHSDELGLENACIFVDGQLHSFLLYHLPSDENFAILNFGRFSYELPHMFEFAVYMYAQLFTGLEVKYTNIEADLSLPALRAIKLALGPSNFFRKYTITPLD